MSDLENFATWLVDNQDKKGTPEFNTVATAFKELDTGAASFAPSSSYLSPPLRDPSVSLPDARQRSFLNEAIDVPIQLGKGIFTGTRFLTDVFGADNPVSQTLSGVEDWLDSLLSAQSKRDQREIARIMQEAEDKGAAAQVLAGLKALTVAPVDLIVNAFGTSGPTLVAGALAAVAGAPVMAVATGVGVLTGVGITKDAAYDAVFQELISAGVSEADAKEAAKEAQAYSGENLDNIALGGFIGGLAAKVGMEPKILTRLIGRRLAGDISEEGLKNAAKVGFIKDVSRTALKEALPEALQGGHEQFASNLALQREGFDTPLGRGVVAGATLEGAVGAPVGAISAVGSKIRPRGTRLAEAEAALTDMLETQEKEAEVRAEEEKVAKEEQAKAGEWGASYEEEVEEEKAAKAEIAKELKRKIDDPEVTAEFEKREREWREKEAKRFVEPREVGPLDSWMQSWLERAPDDVSKLTVKQRREWLITEAAEKTAKAANLKSKSGEAGSKRIAKFYKLKKEALEGYQQNPFNYMGLDGFDLYNLTIADTEVVARGGWGALAADKGIQFVDKEYLEKDRLPASEGALQDVAERLVEFKIIQDALRGLLGPETQREFEGRIKPETRKAIEEEELTPVEVNHLEDALEGLLGPHLQMVLEAQPELQEAVEENKQRRERALKGEFGPEAQVVAEEYLKEIELKEQEVITAEEETGEIQLQTVQQVQTELTNEEQQMLESFVAEINKTQADRPAPEKRQTLEEFLGSLTEAEQDVVLGTGKYRVGKVVRQIALKLQLRDAGAYDHYERVVKEALDKAGYTGQKDKDVVDYIEAENRGIKTVRKEFPRLFVRPVAKRFQHFSGWARIKIAKKLMDDVKAGIYKLNPNFTIDTAKEKEDPAYAVSKTAGAEGREEHYYARSAETLAFSSNDRAAIYPVRGPRLRGDAKNLTGEAKVQALAIHKYFRLEGVRASDPSVPETANPEMALEELAIDLATEPELVADEIYKANPDAHKSPYSSVMVPRLPKSYLLDEAASPERQERGVFRGEEERTGDRQKRIRDAAAWVEGSALSDLQKNNFKARVKEIRQEYSKGIVEAVRKRQLDEEVETTTGVRKILKQINAVTPQKVAIKEKRAIARRVYDKEITIEEAITEVETLIEKETRAKEQITAILEQEEPISDEQLTENIKEETKAVEDQPISIALEDRITAEALPIVKKELGDKWYGRPLKDWPVNAKRRKEFNSMLLLEKAKIRTRLKKEFESKTSAEIAEDIAAYEGDITQVDPGRFKGGPHSLYRSIPAPRTAGEGLAGSKIHHPELFISARREALEPARPVDPLIEEYARTGNLNRTLEALLDSEPKELRPFLRKLRERAAGTRIAITPLFDDTGNEGSYFPDRNIIALDPEYGLNKLTFFHELAHAALDRSLADPNSKEAKAFFEFYSAIQIEMGGAYGGRNLQDFVAEFVSNSEFQSLLKTIKAPKSDSFWVNVVNTILELFGIRKGQSAYDASFKFLDDILTARPSIEATPIERTFLGGENPEIAVKEAIANLEPFSARRAKEVMQDIGGPRATALKAMASGSLRLDNLKQMYGEQLPDIEKIIEAVEKRQGEQEKEIEAINKKYNNFNVVTQKYKAHYISMGTMAIDMRLARVDIFDDAPDPSKVESKKGKAIEEERLKAYNKGNAVYEKLAPPIQKMYKIMRRDFDKMYEEYVDLVLSTIHDPALRAKIKERFDAEPPIAGYIPARRYGEYILKYNDKDSDKAFSVRAFESASERDREIKALGLVPRPDIQEAVDANERAAEAAGTVEPPQEIKKKEDDLKPNEYYTIDSIRDITQRSLPPEGFIKDLMDAVEEDGEKEGIGERQRKAIANTIYEAYVDLFPETSITKSFKRSADVPGASENILQVWGDTMVKWSRKIADIKYNGAIQEGFEGVRRDAAAYRNKRKSPSDPYPSTIEAVGKNISDRETFTLNPTFNQLATGLTTGSYTMFMAGNLSTGVVNLSSIPLLTVPLLAGKFGVVKTTNMITRASTSALTDAWQTDPKYKVLYETLRDHAQLRHTLEREVLEGARQSSLEYTGRWAKALTLLSIPISMTERYNRATTGMAAFDLAKGDGQSDEEAAQYALEIVKDVNTSGMAATAPKWMQNAPGRVMWTFKGFIWNSAYVVARSFVNTVRGETRAVKFEAFKQLIYMYGMSYAVGGLFGLPFVGAIGALTQMVAALDAAMGDDEDEPYNFRAALRTMGLSDLILKGPVNSSFLNIEISNRASIANGIGFREDPYEVEKFGYLASMALQLGGPMGSFALDFGDALGLLAAGELERATERLVPSFARNGLKSTRYLREGVRTRDGRPIDTDLSAWSLYVQAFGFAPADVSSLYEARSLGKNYENKVMERRSNLLKARYLALTTGDTDLYDRAMRRINNFRMLYPRLMSGDSLKRSYKSRSAAESEYIAGIRFNKNFIRNLDPFFNRLENVTYGGL